jgi:hypothetical protein
MCSRRVCNRALSATALVSAHRGASGWTAGEHRGASEADVTKPLHGALPLLVSRPGEKWTAAASRAAAMNTGSRRLLLGRAEQRQFRVTQVRVLPSGE